jgi:hypothetical protein
MAEQMSAAKFDAVLREWVIVDFTFESSIVGRVYGDRRQRFPDGRWIITSALVTPLHKIRSGNVVRTANSRYLLSGTVN